MEKEINADVKKRGSKVKPAGSALPVNLFEVGKAADGDICVYIKQDVYNGAGKSPQPDAKESVSILTGVTVSKAGKTHVIISGAIDLKSAEQTGPDTFTDALNRVEEERKKSRPDMSVVGYRNTRPDGGAAMSGRDASVYEKYFGNAHQVAYIADPVRKERAFFWRREGKTEKLGGYYVYDDAGVPISIERQQDKPEKKARFKKLTAAAVLLLLASTIALAIAVISLTGNQGRYASDSGEAQSLLEVRIEQQQAEIELQKGKIQELEDAISASGAEESELLEQKLAEQQTQLTQREQEMAQMKELLDGIGRKTDGKVVYFKKYVVRKGDALSSICRRNDIKYTSNRRLILAINGIKNENLIRVGQTILLPAVVVLEEQ